MSGASGRLWLTNDGHGRIELQSDSGDVQIVWGPTEVTVYDASSNTAYKLGLPASQSDSSQPHTPATTAQISSFLTQLAQHLDLSGANPTAVGGRPAYEVSAAPKQTGSLLDSLRIAWDAERGAPLSAGIYAKGSAAAALRLAVDSVSYGPVPSSDVEIAPPASAKVVDLGTPSAGRDASRPKPVTGLDAVEAGAGFGVVAPDSVAGRKRTQALLLGDRVLLVYGDGPGSIVVVERKADAAQSAGGMIGALPKVDVNGATGRELSTQLGTAIAWQHDGVGFVLVGSVPAATAESAARDVA
jgi:outer membrane lipoprotein-sorting protein